MDLIKVYDPNIPRVFAIDDSGSTSYEYHYWDKVGQIIKSFFRNDKDYIIIWDTQATAITIEELSKIISKRIGKGCTQPQTFLDYDCLHHENVHLFLITDGEIPLGDVQECDKKIKAYPLHLASVSAFIINDEPDISVVCPFCRNSQSQIFSSSKETDFKEEFYVDESVLHIEEVLDQITTLDEFNSRYDHLFSAFTLRFAGTNGDIAIKEKLIQLRTRLIPHEAGPEIEKAVRSGNFEKALEVLKNLPKGVPESRKIDRLISFANGSITNVFGIDQIKSNRAARAVNVAGIDTSDLNNLGNGTEDNTPVLIVSKLPRKKSLLSFYSKEIVNDVIDFPLNALNHISVIKRIQDHITGQITNEELMETSLDLLQCTPYGSNNYYALGGIPLGEDPTHVKMANKTIMDFVACGKKLGNPDFWFATIYFCLKKMDTDTDGYHYADLMVPQLKYRLRKRFSSLSLSGALNLQQISAPIDICLWYTLNSILFEPDVFNIHARHIQFLLELYEMTYLMPLNDHVKTAVKFVKYKNIIHKIARTNPQEYESGRNNTLYNTITINHPYKKFHIPIDGKSKFNDDKFPIISKILQITDRNVACHLIPIPTEIPEVKKEVYEEWKGYNFVPFTINPNTFRPPVDECPPFNELKNSNNLIVPWTKIYYKATKRNKRFPNVDDLVYEAYLEYVKSGKKKTLMSNVLDISSKVVQAYKPIVDKTKRVDYFIKTYEMSANREKRKEMEKKNIVGRKRCKRGKKV